MRFEYRAKKSSTMSVYFDCFPFFLGFDDR